LIGIKKLATRYIDRYNFRRFHTFTYRVGRQVKKEMDIPIKKLEYLKTLEINTNVLV
jgi:hypothetical protein